MAGARCAVRNKVVECDDYGSERRGGVGERSMRTRELVTYGGLLEGLRDKKISGSTNQRHIIKMGE
jgi:hypothetical protein